MNWKIKMKIVLKFILLFCFINLNNSIKAADYPMKYYKGKFYESVKDNFLVATNYMKDPRFKPLSKEEFPEVNLSISVLSP